MKKYFSILLLIVYLIQIPITAQNFDTHFVDKTLRVDYIFGGNANEQYVMLDQLNELPQWVGKRHNLSKCYLEGNGQIKVYELQSDSCIYMNTFSSLFQEWLTTKEANTISRSFENVYLLPFPKEKVRIELSFRNSEGKYLPKIEHIFDPNDILIHKQGYGHTTPYTVIGDKSSASTSINVAIVAEGFTEKEIDSFKSYAIESINQIFAHEPFNKYQNRFNFYIVESISNDSGVSVPREGLWKHTAIGSHFDTFYSERYLTTSKMKDLHNLLAGIPYEHIIILANTDVYGGGGIFNAYTLTTTGHPGFKPVVVHEFGHSFGGLADEYFYDVDVFDDTYPINTEPWEKNITTLTNFSSKWHNMLSENTPIPTALKDSTTYSVGVYEGAGYSAKGVYKGCLDCRMKTNTSQTFCPVCQRSLEELILFYLKEL